MTNAQTGTLVLKDNADTYYLLPLETLEQCRVPAEHNDEVERLIIEQQDVQGHIFHIVHLARTAAVILTGAVLVAQEATKGPEAIAPNLDLSGSGSREPLP